MALGKTSLYLLCDRHCEGPVLNHVFDHARCPATLRVKKVFIGDTHRCTHLRMSYGIIWYTYVYTLSRMYACVISQNALCLHETLRHTFYIYIYMYAVMLAPTTHFMWGRLVCTKSLHGRFLQALLCSTRLCASCVIDVRFVVLDCLLQQNDGFVSLHS